MPPLRVAYLEPAAARRYRFEARLPDLALDNSPESAVTSFDYRWAILGTPPRACQLGFRGDAGANRLVGTAGGDRINGFGGRDRLIGGAGDDCLRGGSGRDTLDCGPGEDVAHVDRLDSSRGCERVIRGS
jgi:Ca2+-binding RTX toxin-like protein